MSLLVTSLGRDTHVDWQDCLKQSEKSSFLQVLSVCSVDEVSVSVRCESVTQHFSSSGVYFCISACRWRFFLVETQIAQPQPVWVSSWGRWWVAAAADRQTGTAAGQTAREEGSRVSLRVSGRWSVEGAEPSQPRGHWAPPYCLSFHVPWRGRFERMLVGMTSRWLPNMISELMHSCHDSCPCWCASVFTGQELNGSQSWRFYDGCHITLRLKSFKIQSASVCDIRFHCWR